MASVVEVEEGDLWALLYNSLRYSLGRQSYVVGETCDLFNKYGNRLTTDQLFQVAAAIEKEVERFHSLGRALPLADEWLRCVEELKTAAARR
jgi:hypothetical protein